MMRINLQFAKFTKSSNGTAIESFDYICSLCHKSWDQCTCIEICGYCLRGWKTIWYDAGIGEYANCQFAKDFGSFLIKYGFREIPITWDYSEIPTLQQYTPQIGETRVWQPYQGQEPAAGHIDWWNGTNWCSDYKQFNKWWPGKPYERNHPHYIIYR